MIDLLNMGVETCAVLTVRCDVEVSSIIFSIYFMSNRYFFPKVQNIVGVLLPTVFLTF